MAASPDSNSHSNGSSSLGTESVSSLHRGGAPFYKNLLVSFRLPREQLAVGDNVTPNANTTLREATMEIRHADLQIEVEDAEDGGVLLTIIDSARLSLSLPRKTAKELLDAIDACMKTGERQTTDSVDVWRTADDLPLFGMHVGIDGASWTCGAVRSWDVDGLADGLEALLA